MFLLKIGLLVMLSFSASATSLWDENDTFNPAVRFRPRIGLGDIILVTVAEKTQSQNNMKTEIKDEHNVNTDVLGKLKQVFRLSHMPEASNLVDRFVDNLQNTSHSSDMKGEGKISSDASLSTAISVFVKQVLPNGNLGVEGTKTVLLNSESHEIKLSGIIRPEDVVNNTIESTKIANAQISLIGDGAMNGTKKPGILQRIYNILF